MQAVYEGQIHAVGVGVGVSVGVGVGVGMVEAIL